MNLSLRKPLDQITRDYLKSIYHDAFPVEEQRPWQDILSEHNGELSLEGVYVDDTPIGLITSWRFADCYYIEHFAIDRRRRGIGIGSKAIALLVERAHAAGVPLLLEVEPADISPEAAARIAFYRRAGLDIIDREYIQPPYQPHLPGVAMWLMASAPISPTLASALLHTKVYGKEIP